MFALFLATWIQSQAQEILAERVAACIEMNEFSCSDKDARENDDLVACLLRIPCEIEAVRAEFERRTQAICPEQRKLKKINHSWSY